MSDSPQSEPAKLFIERLEFRGANLDFLGCHDHEVIICSPSDTGKTYAACYKSIILALNVDGYTGALVRKTYHSLRQSVVKTMDRIMAGLPVRRLGGSGLDQYMFPNGSTIVAVGMDKADKLLSSEWDAIQVCQSEELMENDWEIMSSRCTGRGAKVKHPQIFGDCNPAGSKHWIRQRSTKGLMKLITGSHRDNPELYDAAGNRTEMGVKRIGFLETTLSGVRRKRLLEGIWATAEGAVYEQFDAAVHVQVRDVASMKRWLLTIDDGYTNPAVILLIGEDADGRWHCHREFFKTGQFRATVVNEALLWANQYRVETTSVDAQAAELIAQCINIGLNAVPGKGTIDGGIRAVQDRLRVQGDGLPRYTVDPSCVNHINEFESYVYKPGQDVPLKENDHSMDALRYLCYVMGEGTGALKGLSDLYVPPSLVEHIMGAAELLRPEDMG